MVAASGLPGTTTWVSTGSDGRAYCTTLQAIPLVAPGLVLLVRRYPALRPQGPRTALVAVAAAAYAGLIWLVTWQAERGEYLLHPGTSTLLATGSLLSATIIASLAVLLRAQRTTLASARFPK